MTPMLSYIACMGLKVFSGAKQANRSYENKFFRVFSSNLSALFKEKNYNGILLGHPKSRENRWLQPDALLITTDSITIIDFKNFDQSTLILPKEALFANSPWKAQSHTERTGSSVEVKGGTAANPFAQLRRQMDWEPHQMYRSGISAWGTLSL